MPKVGGQTCREVQPDAVPHLGWRCKGVGVYYGLIVSVGKATHGGVGINKPQPLRCNA